MSLSPESRRRLKTALTSEKVGKEVADAIDTGGNPDVATTTASGLMSASDKVKLNGIEAEANKYVLPAATTAAAGGVKQATNVPEAAGAAPTAAEFKALLDALIASGSMAAPG